MQRLGVHARLYERFGPIGHAIWVGFAAAVLLGSNALLAALVAAPLLFVSLGPIILQRVERPVAEGSSNRATVFGNLSAVVIGYCVLRVFALRVHPSLLVTLGFVRDAHSLLVLCLGVVIACTTSTILERAAGIPTPCWRNRPPREAEPAIASFPEALTAP